MAFTSGTSNSFEESSEIDDPFKMIRNNFNFTFICEFMHKFSSAFFNGPDDVLPTSPFLEHLLLYQDDPKKLNQFYIKLLKPLPGWRLVNHENWFESLAKEYKKRDLEVDFISDIPATSSTILTVPLLKRLEILRNLCEFHLEQPEHFWELFRVKDGEADWRIEPIGMDSKNRRYWLFSDARMYREIEGFEDKSVKNKRKQKTNADDSVLPWDIEDENNWELICLTRADYDEFMNSAFPSPVKPKDKLFLKMIREEIIPQVEPVLSYQLSQHKKYFRPVASERTFLMPRKRSSRLLEKEFEEEQRRAEEQAAEKERRKLMNEHTANIYSAVAPPVKSREEIEKDLAAEREMRAEMRRSKKEKEMQIKAIEEAFYSSYNPETENTTKSNEESTEESKEESNEESDSDGHVDIISGSDAEKIPKSPIKLVLKMNMKKPEIVPDDLIKLTDSVVIDDDCTTNDIINCDNQDSQVGPNDELLGIIGDVTENNTTEQVIQSDPIKSDNKIVDIQVISEEDARLLFNYKMNNI